MQAVILAGGKGTRLASRLNGLPKPLVSVNGVPLLERQLVSLSRQGVTEALVLVNHEAQQIEEFLASKNFGCRTIVINDGQPRGTSGAVLACLDRLAENFLVVYGDTLFDIDIAALVKAHISNQADATLLLHPNDHPADSDLVEVDDDGWIRAFHSYPHPVGAWLPNLVNAAFYSVEKRLISRYQDLEVPSDFAKDLFPLAVKQGARLAGYRSFEYIKDLGTPSRLKKVERHLATGVIARARRSERQSAVFIDRDGTINALRDYVRTAEELELLPNAAASIRKLNEAERRVVLITNQPVLARGECSFEEMRRIHARLDTELGLSGAYIDALYYCPHHPHGGYPGEVAALKIDCDCRKPKPGMIKRAIADLNIDPARSFMIGDSAGDVISAQRAGVAGILVASGEKPRADGHVFRPDFTATDLNAAVSFIIEQHPRLQQLVRPIAMDIRPGDLVVIGGFARSGKSTIASVIAGKLRARGLRADVIPLDSWIRSQGERKDGVLGRYDLAAVQTALGSWLEGGSAQFELPFYDRQTRTKRSGETRTLAPNTVVILEGVPAFLLALETKRKLHRLYVESGEEARRGRVIEDLKWRGAADDSAETIYAERQHDETPAIQKSLDAAQWILNPDSIYSQTAGPEHDH